MKKLMLLIILFLLYVYAFEDAPSDPPDTIRKQARHHISQPAELTAKAHAWATQWLIDHTPKKEN